MADSMHQQLLGHLLGALDDAEDEWLDVLLECDEDCCRELVRWRRKLARLEAMRPDFEPPHGLAERTCRYLAACRASASSSGHRAKMSPCPAPSARGTSLGMPDMAALAVLLLLAIALIFPAIDQSRLAARVAWCQNGLRQFELALSQYGQQQQSPLTELTADGRLTQAGIFAVARLREGSPGAGGRQTDRESLPPTCPEAWLAAQGVSATVLDDTLEDKTPVLLNGLAVAAADPPIQSNPPIQSSAPIAGDVAGTWQSRSQRDSRGLEDASPSGGIDSHEQGTDWPGAWRNGMTVVRHTAFLPAETPLLADAPSADLPGQILSNHGGRGRNLWFEDGRVIFRATAPTDDVRPVLLINHGLMRD
jgi:hypothetical protein